MTEWKYDAAGNVIQVTRYAAPINQTYITTYTYDGTSTRVASITQSDGSSVNFTYELVSGQYRVKTYTDGEGRVTTLAYTTLSSGGGTTASANPAALTTPSTWSTAAISCQCARFRELVPRFRELVPG